MATTAAGVPERNVSIGRVMSRGFGTLASNPLVTFGIAFLFGALPSVLIAYAIERLRPDLTTGMVPSFTLGMVGLAVASALASIALAMITQGALVRATIAHSEGRKASMGESITAGLRVALPLFFLAILTALGVGAAMLLLIVPGIMLYIMWSVAAPALVEERLGPIEALGRSRFLTSGMRWKIFGLELVLLVCYWLFSAVVGVALISMYGGPTELAAAVTTGLSVGYFVVNAISQTLVAAFWGVMQTSLYVELREWKDGPAAEALADVFR